MGSINRRRFVGGMLASIGSAAWPVAKAADYPTKPLRLIIPFGAGGPTDTLGRALAERLTAQFGQNVVVENRTGAGGNIGTDVVAKATPDGYTLLLTTNGPLAGNLTLFKQLPYDPLKDFAPITLFTYLPNMLAVHPSLPVNNFAEFIEYVKARPNQLSFGSGGNGTSSHLAGELLKVMTGIQMTHIPYKGDGASMTDIISGQIPIVFCSVLAGMRYIDSGRIKVLAVTSAKRVPAIGNVPTIAESGLPGYDFAAWYSVMAPAGTPRDIIQKLNSTIVGIINTPDFKAKIEGMGGIPVGSTPEAVTAIIKEDIPKWAKLIKESGAKVD